MVSKPITEKEADEEVQSDEIPEISKSEEESNEDDSEDPMQEKEDIATE